MSEGPAQAVSGGVSKGASFLKARMFGMPRWAFLGLIVGGVSIGLYLRARQNAMQQSDQEAANAATPAIGSSGYTIDGSMDPGLAGAGGGMIGPAGGAITPVSTPFIPEGYSDVFGILGDTISNLSADNSDGRMQSAQTSQFLAEQLAALAAAKSVTGGGPPDPAPHAPPKPPKPKPPKPPKYHGPKDNGNGGDHGHGGQHGGNHNPNQNASQQRRPMVRR